MKIAVLASGSGTNLQSLLDAQTRGALAPGRIVVVGSNVPGCQALARATAAGVDTFALSHRAFADRAAFDVALLAELQSRDIELVVLAGFMRILTSEFLARFPDRVVNIHPSLLPAFPGIHAQAQAFQYGVKLAGCTVHFVEPAMDSGPIIAQAAIPVRDDDNEDSLRLRILSEEHRIFPEAVQAIASGRVRRDGRHVIVTPPA